MGVGKAPNTPRPSQKLCWAGFWRSTGSHRTHLLRRTQPTTVAHGSKLSVGDLAARPQGGVGDVLRALGGGVVFSGPVLAAQHAARLRRVCLIDTCRGAPLIGTPPTEGAHGRRRRPDEAIALSVNSWEPIDARAGLRWRRRSWCICFRSTTNWMFSPNTSSSTTAIRDPFVPRRLV